MDEKHLGIKEVIDLLKYVNEETVMNDNGEWTLGPGYDPGKVVEVIGILEQYSEEIDKEEEEETFSKSDLLVERYENLVFEFTTLLLQTMDFDGLMKLQPSEYSGLTNNIPPVREVIKQAKVLAGIYLEEENWRYIERNARNN